MGVARNVIKDAKLVPGGGASEMAVAAILKKKSMSIEGVEQVGICVQSMSSEDPVCNIRVIIYRCFIASLDSRGFLTSRRLWCKQF